MLGAPVPSLVEVTVRKLVLGMTFLACGREQHTFVPGPGMSAASLEFGLCSMSSFCGGMKTGFAFQASGSPKFVAASTGGAAIGYAIGSAIEQNSNFNDCMEARGGSLPTVSDQLPQ